MAFTKVLGPGIHTQANILSHNINSSGIITATKFVGPFDGTTIGSGTTIGADGINVTGIVTATSLDINGNGDISGNLVVGGNLTANGDLTTLNTTLREVELLRVDANSSAAAGIITQTGAGDILNLFDGTTEVFTVLDTGEVGINQSTPTRNLHIDGTAHQSGIIIHTAGNHSTAIDMDSNRSGAGSGIAELNFKWNGTTVGQIGAYSGSDTSNKDDAHIHFGTASAGSIVERLRITSTGLVGIGTVATLGDAKLTVEGVTTLANIDQTIMVRDSNADDAVGRGGNIGFGGYVNGTMRTLAGMGALKTNAGNSFNGDLALYTRENGESNLSERLRITSAGNVGIGTNNPSSGKLQVQDGSISVKGASTPNINFAPGSGGSGNADISFDATDLKIISNSSSANIRIAAYSKSDHIVVRPNGNIGIRTDNPENADSMQIFGATTPMLTIKAGATGSDANRRASLRLWTNGNKVYKLEADASDGGLKIYDSSSARLVIDTNGHITPGAADSQDLGSTSKEFRNLYIGNSGRVYLGDAQEVSLYHDGNNTYLVGGSDAGLMQVKNLGGGDVECFSNHGVKLRVNGGENAVVCNHNSSVDLYFDGGSYTTPKLKTSHYGVTIDGEVAASQDYPNIRPTLDFNFAAVKKLDPRITYSRTGPASYTDELGYLKLVGPNVPRFDHDPYTRESKGLLIEESRTNLMKSAIHPHVGKYTYGSNSNGAIVEVSDDVLAPDGSALTLKLHWTNYTATHNGYIRVGNQTEIGTLAAATYGFSFFVKRGTDGNHNMEEFLAGTATGIGDAQHHFTIQEFSPASSANVKLCNNSNVTIDKYPDGWYRLSGTITTSGSSNPDNTGASYYVLASSNFKTFFEAMPFYHWGFQLEVGACPSSYIGGTVSATTTRGWEVPTITGTDLTDVFNPTEGTMFYEASVSSLTNDNQPIVAFRDLGTTTDNYHAMGYRIGGGSSGNIRTWFKSNNANTYLSNHGSTGMVAGSPYKHMYGYKLNDATDAYNTGAASNQTTDSSVTPMLTSGVVDELRFGGYYSGPETTTYSLEAGHIKRFSYWNTKLSNTQIRTYVS